MNTDPSQGSDPVYELPQNSDQALRKMGIGLGLFFTSLVLLVALVMWQAQNIARYIPFSAEQRFVRPYESALSRMFGDSTRSSPKIEQYLQELSEKLARAMDLDESIELTVHYLDIDDTNAFATLGGHVFILSGLLKSLPDENSLAMVLAHEIAHVQHRDPAAAMSRGMALQMVYGFATGGGSADITGMFGNLGESMYSRRQEGSADIAALHAISELYGHVAGYRTFFEQLRALNTEEESNQFEKWFASHPAIVQRLDELDQEVERMGARSDKTVPYPEYVKNKI